MKQELFERYLVAQDLLKEEKTAEAKAILVELSNLDDSNPFVDVNLASILARENDFVSAAKHYLKARSALHKLNDESLNKEIDFINDQLCNLTGDLSEQAEKLIIDGDFDKAELYLRTTKELGSLYANYNLAMLNIKRNRYDLARDHLKESLDMGLKLFASTDSTTKSTASNLLATTHNTIGALDIQGHGCPDGEPNALRAMQNFKSALTFEPNHSLAKEHKARLKSMIAPQSLSFFKQETSSLKQVNGRISFFNFIVQYAHTANINAYIKANPGFDPSSAIDDLLSNYLAGTSKKISFNEEDELSEFGAKMNI